MNANNIIIEPFLIMSFLQNEFSEYALVSAQTTLLFSTSFAQKSYYQVMISDVKSVLRVLAVIVSC